MDESERRAKRQKQLIRDRVRCPFFVYSDGKNVVACESPLMPGAGHPALTKTTYRRYGDFVRQINEVCSRYDTAKICPIAQALAKYYDNQEDG